MMLEHNFSWSDRVIAEREGWGMFESDSRGLEIEADHESEIFMRAGGASDREARRFVRIRAREGSPMHQRALAYHQRQKKVRRWPFRHNLETAYV